MCLDLDKKELKYIINGHDYGKTDANIKPGGYRAAISLYHDKDTVQLL